MGEQPKHRTRARRFKFHLRRIFPSSDPQSIPLLRLMMATDDVRHLQKLMILADERVKEANETERSILNGEINHLNRLLCGHLYEAGVAFRNFEVKCSGSLESAVADNPEIKRDLEYLKQVYAGDQKGTFHYSFLKPLRDMIGFHYKEEPLRRRLEEHNKAGDLEGNLIVAELPGFGRYSVSDHLAISILHELLDVPLEDFQQSFEKSMGEAIRLAKALFGVVDHILLRVFQERPDAIIEQQDGEVMVSPEFLRGKEKAEESEEDKTE